MKEQSLIIIKPGFIKDEKGIVDMLTKNAGVKIIQRAKMRLTKDILYKHYEEHIGKSFFDELVKYMGSDDVIVMVAEGPEGSIKRIREVCGATKNPAEGTIRAKFGIGEITRNVIHSSDSVESGKREISNFKGLLKKV